jgi:prepilin-type N-terminal cleavage/methylation domain-containing protein
MNRARTTGRRGFTLLELLVVIALMMTLAAIALLVSPRLSEDQRSVRSADLVSGWLLISKQRALRDQLPRGIRLIPSPDSTGALTWVKEVAYVERPVDYRPPVTVNLQYPVPPALASFVPAGVPNTATVLISGKDLTNATSPGNPIVSVGDFLVFDTLETPPNNSHRIMQLVVIPVGTAALPRGGTLIVIGATDGTPTGIYFGTINGGNPIPATAATGSGTAAAFRFVRAVRPMAGEDVLQLPKDMIIDLSPLTPGPSSLPGIPAASMPGPGNSAGGFDGYDIVFSPRGVIQGSNGSAGKVILRVRNASRSPTDGDQLYVTVYTATGLIATHPVNLTNSPNWYSFTQDGNSSGF